MLEDQTLAKKYTVRVAIFAAAFFVFFAAFSYDFSRIPSDKSLHREILNPYRKLRQRKAEL